MMYAGLLRLVQTWLQQTHLTTDVQQLRHELLTHPDLPSVSALTDTFDALGISNLVAQINEEHLEQLPTPFLAVLRDCVKEVHAFHTLKKYLLTIETKTIMLSNLLKNKVHESDL